MKIFFEIFWFGTIQNLKELCRKQKHVSQLVCYTFFSTTEMELDITRTAEH